VLGVIMFGSWARGNNRPDSDVDLVIILTEGYRRTVEYKNGQAFEIIYTTVKGAVEFWQIKKDDCADLWAVAKILYDKDGTMVELKKQAEEIIKVGKKPVDQYQKGQFEFSIKDELVAIKSIAEKDPTTASLVISKTALLLTELFFDFRQMWTPAPKQRLIKLKVISPELYKLFEEFYSTPVLKNKIELIEKITPLVFEIN